MDINEIKGYVSSHMEKLYTLHRELLDFKW